MTVEADLFTLLTSLTSGRVYPDVAPAGAARPYIVYQQVGGQSPSFLENALLSKKNGRYQFSSWADTRAAAAALALQVESAILLSVPLQATPLGAPIAAYDEETLRYGAHQDFSIWSNR